MILIVIYLICWKCGNFGLTLLPIKQKTVTGGGFAPVYGTREIHHRRHIISAAVIGQGIPSIGAKKTMLLYCWQVRSSDLLSEKKKKLNTMKYFTHLSCSRLPTRKTKTAEIADSTTTGRHTHATSEQQQQQQ